MYVQILNPIDEKSYLSPKQAETLVYRGEAVFVGEERRQLRYLEAYEQMRLRRNIALDRERLMDDAMIENGRQVVYWNAGDPEGRHLPGQVRS